MPDEATVAELLREMSSVLRTNAAAIADVALKRRIAEAALELAQIAEALDRTAKTKS